MTRACLGLLAGMYALQLSSFADDSDYMSVAIIAGFALLLTGQFRVLVWFCAGVALFVTASHNVIDSRISTDLVGDSLVIDVKVESFPSRSGSTVSFLTAPVDHDQLPRHIRLSWFEPPVNIRYGDTWRLEVRLRRPRGNRNAGGFDYEAWLFRERIGAVGYVVNSRRNHLLIAESAGITERVRLRFVARVHELVGENERSSVLVALVVGTRHLITPEQWDRYARTGTSHLVAISGLHIGLAAAAAYLMALLIAGIMGGVGNHHRAAVTFSIIVAVLYAQVSGFAIPARRASLMLVLAGLALLRKQRPDLIRIFSASCMALAVADPLSTIAPGFVLSFAAVIVLIWIAQRRQSAHLAIVQVTLFFGLLPLTVIFFDRIVFAALPVNLIAVPLFSFVTVPLSLLGLLLDGPLRWIGDQAIVLAGHSVGLLEAVVAIVASAGWAAYTVPAIAGIMWLSVVSPIVWVIVPPGWPGRYLAWLGVVAILLQEPRRPDAGCVALDVLDVGHGLAVVIRTNHHVMLYDTGPSYRGGGSSAESVVLPFLANVGFGAIDRMVVSHADLDHAGGVAAIVAGSSVDLILSGESLTTVESIACRSGQRWARDGIEFRVLHPPPISKFEGNDRSCVVLIEAGRYRILLSGDIERPAEYRLVRERLLPPVDVVLIPHHGSRTSSSMPFVQALSPSVAIVSAAFGNHWGFPKEDIVARWEAVGAEVLNTATSGAIGLRMCADSGLESITQYRVENRRIWHE
jgi:competence protein ComEC